jgi:acetyl esterase/lipase
MRPALALALAAALAGCSVSKPPAPPLPAQPELMKWPALLERPRPEPDATLAYGDDQMQKVDLWLPRGKGPHPTVLMIHGGCWQTEIADRRIMNWIADDLRKRGIAVWNIDYRGVDRTGGGYPGTFRDVAAAADALPKQARRYGLDDSRLVVVGHSAGGHLALWLAGRLEERKAPFEIRLVVQRPGSSATLESEVTEPIGRILLALPGADGLESTSADGRSQTLVSFKAGTSEGQALAAVRAALPAIRAALPPGQGDPQLSVEGSGIPPDSPLFAEHPLPIVAVVAAGGLPDLKLTATPPGSGCGTEVVQSLVGTPSPDRPDVYADTSAAVLPRIRARQFLVNGAEDRIIPVGFAASYRDLRVAKGERVEIEIVPRTGHVELIAPESAAWQRQAAIIQNIFREKPVRVNVIQRP